MSTIVKLVAGPWIVAKSAWAIPKREIGIRTWDFGSSPGRVSDMKVKWSWTRKRAATEAKISFSMCFSPTFEMSEPNTGVAKLAII